MINQVTVLGATGSIGDNTLDVIRRNTHRFGVYALSAHASISKLAGLCTEFQPRFAVLSDPEKAAQLQDLLAASHCDTEVLAGVEALNQVAADAEVDTVVTGIVGAVGLLPTWSAVTAGKRVLIANKEPLVMMGREIVTLARASGAEIIPLDSEHNALFQCLPDSYRIGSTEGLRSVRRILLTGSGGPFRTTGADRLAHVTPAQAIAHPNWSMGPKISVDSATLMNKGLELIEACCLFSVAAKHVDVVIHPQSTIHSMIEYDDGSVIAQMGNSDMRIPIAHGLGWPERIESGGEFLDFTRLTALEFEAPDEERFPCLRLAREVADLSGTAPAILNAANEVAVQCFLDNKIAFTAIPEIIEHTLENVATEPDQNIDCVLEADTRARQTATLHASELSTGKVVS